MKKLYLALLSATVAALVYSQVITPPVVAPFVPVWGEQAIHDNAVATGLPTQNTWVQVTGIWQCGHISGVTCNGDSLTIGSAGGYLVNASGAAAGGNNNQAHQFAIFVNGVLSPDSSYSRTIASQSQFTVAIAGINPMSAGDVVDLRARSTTTGATSVTVNTLTLSVKN